ncbi:MAG: hypothetical protein WCR56_04375 [Bacilli bacterium]
MTTEELKIRVTEYELLLMLNALTDECLNDEEKLKIASKEKQQTMESVIKQEILVLDHTRFKLRSKLDPKYYYNSLIADDQIRKRGK